MKRTRPQSRDRPALNAFKALRRVLLASHDDHAPRTSLSADVIVPKGKQGLKRLSNYSAAYGVRVDTFTRLRKAVEAKRFGQK